MWTRPKSGKYVRYGTVLILVTDLDQGFSTHFPLWTTMPIQISLWTSARKKAVSILPLTA